MTKSELTIKQQITYNDMITISEKVVSGYFKDELDDYKNPTGKVLYTPYYHEYMLAALFVQFAVDGIKYDEHEDPYLSIIADDDLMEIYPNWLKDLAHTTEPLLAEQMKIVWDWIDDKLEVEKQKHIQEAGLNYEIKMLIRSVKDVLALQQEALERQKQLETLLSPEEQAEFAKKMASSNFDPNKIAEKSVELFYDKQNGAQHLKAIDHKNAVLRKLHEAHPDTYKKVLAEVDAAEKIVPLSSKK